MPLLILAMIFAVVQTPPPVPRKAPDKQAHEAAQNKQSTNANQPQSPISTFPTALPSSDKHEESPTEPTKDNAAKTVIISEPATVARKDAWDRAYVIATLLLVGIGGWGVFYARKSLEAIESQLGTMGQQVTEMQNAGKQTDTLIETMKDTAERELRAYVCIGGAQIGFIQERAPVVHVEIQNFGKTPAYNVQMWIGAALGACPIPTNIQLEQKRDSLRMSTSVLAPKGKPYTLPFQHPVIPPFAMNLLGTPDLTMYVYGEIRYVDAFGKDRRTGYRLMFGGSTRQTLTRNKRGVPVANLRTAENGNYAD